MLDEETIAKNLAPEIVKIPADGFEWLMKRTHTEPTHALHRIKARAEEFGISIESALLIRKRYLLEELALWNEYINRPVNTIGCFPYANIQRIQKELEVIETVKTGPATKEQKVTPEMIDRARAVPVDTLVEFKNGKAHCFNHDDKIPSMFHGTKINRAVCPSGCNKSFDPIAILVIRDGYSFQDAVIRLSGG